MSHTSSESTSLKSLIGPRSDFPARQMRTYFAVISVTPVVSSALSNPVRRADHRRRLEGDTHRYPTLHPPAVVRWIRSVPETCGPSRGRCLSPVPEYCARDWCVGFVHLLLDCSSAVSYSSSDIQNPASRSRSSSVRNVTVSSLLPRMRIPTTPVIERPCRRAICRASRSSIGGRGRVPRVT